MRISIRFVRVRGFDVIYSALKANKAVHGDLLEPVSLCCLKMMLIFHLKVEHEAGQKMRTLFATDFEHKINLEELGFAFESPVLINSFRQDLVRIQDLT
jgi:hypothetical protein